MKYIQRLIRLIRQDFKLLYRTFIDPTTPWYLKALILGTGVYAILPFDGVMDLIPFFGQIDDIALIIMLIKGIKYWHEKNNQTPNRRRTTAKVK